MVSIPRAVEQCYSQQRADLPTAHSPDTVDLHGPALMPVRARDQFGPDNFGPDNSIQGGRSMAEPFLSEIRIMSFVFPPKGWALCDGQLLPINQNQALFSLLGTTYGGDGRVNFGLPDLRSRTPLHQGGSHTLGERGGEQAHTLNGNELPTPTQQANPPAAPACPRVPS